MHVRMKFSFISNLSQHLIEIIYLIEIILSMQVLKEKNKLSILSL